MVRFNQQFACWLGSILKSIENHGGKTALACALISIVAASVLAVWRPDVPDQVSDDFLSIEFLAVWSFAVLTAAAVHRTFVTPYILFLLTTLFFIGGRFFAYQLGFPEDPFFDKNFKLIDLSSDEAEALMSFITPSLLSIHAGYMAYWWKHEAKPTASPAPTAFTKTLWIPAAILIAICTPLAFMGAYQTLQISLSGSYTDIYLNRTEYGTRWSVLAQYGLLLSLGLAFASQRRSVEIIGFTVFLLFSFTMLGIGVRSSLLSFLLLAIWLFHNRIMRVRSIALVAALVLMTGLAIVSVSFNARTSEAGSEGSASSMAARIWHVRQNTSPRMLLYFVHNQGTSLLSVHVASTIEDYPWQAYVQTFVPGFGAISSLLDSPHAINDLYFGQHMAKTWIPERFARGEGFGWSLFSDLIVFSGKNKAFLLLAGAILGLLFASLADAATRSAVWFGALVVLTPKIVLLPRSGLYSIFPYLFVFLGIVAGWWVLQRLLAPNEGEPAAA